MSYLQAKINKKDALIKGRIAESLVRELLSMLEMDVYAYGIECQLPRIARLHHAGQVERNVALMHVANQPDFIVCAHHNNKATVYRVEVKFRANGKINVSELSCYDDDVIFVLMDMETFYVLEKADLDKKYKGRSRLLFKSLRRLSQDSVFAFTPYQKKVVFEFSQYVSKYLGSPHIMGHLKPDKMLEDKQTPLFKRVLSRLKRM